MTRQKILVLGATGNVGEPLVTELAKRGANVRAAVRHPSGRVRDFKNVEYIPFDFFDSATYSKAFSGVDRVYLLTPSLENPIKLIEGLLQAAKDAGVKHIVRQSAHGAEATNGKKIRLLSWHREAERVIEESGLPYTFLRPMGFFQNYLNFMGTTIISDGAFYLPMADARACYIDARDVANVAATVLTEDGHEGEMYSLTGPEPLSNYEIAEKLSHVVGRRIRYVAISDQEMLAGAREMGTPDWMAQGLLELYQFWREGNAQLISPLVEKLTERPAIGFERFAREFASSFSAPGKERKTA